MEKIFQRIEGTGDELGEYRVGGDNAKIELLPSDLLASRELGQPPATIPHGESIYPSTAAALYDFARHRPEAEELIFLGYTGRMFALDLRDLQVPWRINKMRVLVHDMEVVDISLPGALPKDAQQLRSRQDDSKTAASDLESRIKDRYQVKRLDIRYIRGHPMVRALVLRKEIGCIRFYEKSDDLSDLAALGQPILKLSSESPYMQALLQSVVQWFDFVWQCGSYAKPKGFRSRTGRGGTR